MRYAIRITSALVFSCLLVACAAGSLPGGQDSDGADAAPGSSADAGPGSSSPDATPGQPQTVTLRATDSDRIVSGHSVGCMESEGNFHLDNHYYRWFDLASMGITGSLAVTSVDIGLEVAQAGTGGSQQATVTLYQQAGAFNFASLSPLVSMPLTVSDQTGTVLPVSIAGVVPAGMNLVVEFHTPDGEAAQDVLLMGSNPDGERAPTFISAEGCDLAAPVPTSDAVISRSDMHWVMRINGLHTP